MNPHTRQLLLDGRTLEEADAPPPKPAPKPAPLRGYARWAADVDGVRTLEDLAAVWWPGSRGWGPWRDACTMRQARTRVDDLCRLGHVLPPVNGWHRDTVPQRATPEAVAAMLAPVDGRSTVAQLGMAWFARANAPGARAAWRRLQWLRARRVIARLPGAYYPERRGAYVPRREGA